MPQPFTPPPTTATSKGARPTFPPRLVPRFCFGANLMAILNERHRKSNETFGPTLAGAVRTWIRCLDEVDGAFLADPANGIRRAIVGYEGVRLGHVGDPN